MEYGGGDVLYLLHRVLLEHDGPELHVAVHHGIHGYISIGCFEGICGVDTLGNRNA